MKILAFLMLAAGWIICLAALQLLSAPAPRAIFLYAGLAVEILGLILAFRAHTLPRGERG